MDSQNNFVSIGTKRVGDSQPCYVIAEIGTGYNIVSSSLTDTFASLGLFAGCVERMSP